MPSLGADLEGAHGVAREAEQRHVPAKTSLCLSASTSSASFRMDREGLGRAGGGGRVG